MEYPLCRMPESTPRQRTGACSMASDAPTPHSPPMPIPNSMRKAKNDGVVRREAAQQLDRGEEEHVDHQRTAAAIAVGHHAEHQRANGPHRQRGCNRQDDVAFGDAEMFRQRVEQKDDDEEIEGI